MVNLFKSLTYSLQHEPCSDQGLLAVTNTHLLSQGDHAFQGVAPRLCYTLPPTLRSADSVVSFKRQPKMLLFRQAFDKYRMSVVHFLCLYVCFIFILLLFNLSILSLMSSVYFVLCKAFCDLLA